MNTFTYEDVSIDLPSLAYQLLLAGQAEGGQSYNSNTMQLVVYTDLDEATSDGVVAAHDQDSLFSKKLTKVLLFQENSSKLLNNGITYKSALMSATSESKSFYSSVASDDDSAGVTINYPLQLPAVTGPPLVLADRSDLDGLINAVNERMIYLYEDQVNGDGSKGLVAYAGDIWAAASIGELDAIVDTRA